MDRQLINKRKIRRSLIIVFLIIMLFVMATAAAMFTVRSIAEGENGSGKEIVIETVEDIPAGEIEEQEVPLAAMPQTSELVEMRHAVMMIVLLLGTAAYSVYFIRYEKKLVMLRRLAAEAEALAMKNRRDREVQR